VSIFFRFMWKNLRIRPHNGRLLSTALSIRSSELKHTDPFKVLSLPETATRDELRNKFFELAKTEHGTLTGNQEKFQSIIEAYEDAIKIADEKNPIAPWDGLSPMTYAQAWQGKDYWRRLWESHWATRLAHMYKHRTEMTDLEANLQWREAQNMQVRDWMVLAKEVMDPKTKDDWKSACELANDMILWTRTNKTNYRRYYVSNTNEAVNMQQVYQEHEFWRHHEATQWAEWDAFFARASAWAMENESRIRGANNVEGPLAAKFDLLFRGRLQYASMPLEEKLTQRQAEEKAYTRMYWKAEALKAVRFLFRWTERFGRGFFPVLIFVVIVGYIFDFQVFRRFINVSRSDTGALEVHHRKVDMVDWLVAGMPAPEKIDSIA